MDESQRAWMTDVRSVVGAAHVITGASQTRPYRTGFRFGEGDALAVVRPGSLVELWRVLQACIAGRKAVIMQAANTGLTGGSTPYGDGYDRDVVIISVNRIDRVHLIGGGQQVICLPGSTLYQLEAALKPLGREPHSVIGSSCIGASVIGGICNNSGGALIRRGPAYTELALFARVNADGSLELVNHLGVRLPENPEEALELVERGEFRPSDVADAGERQASDDDYARRVREVSSDKPARFNADPGRLFEASGSAGKIAVFAVRLDTFPSDSETRVFYIGTNDPAELTDLRRHFLQAFENLPVSGEYMHRTCFDIAEQYGKDTYLAIKHFGTGRIPALFKWKAKLDSVASKLGAKNGFSDRFLQRLGGFAPDHLPPNIRRFRDFYEHHLILRMSDGGIGEARRYLEDRFPSKAGDFLECSREEGEMAFLHRFAAAGAAIRYRDIHRSSVEGIISLDIALPRNEEQWVETLPDSLSSKLVHSLYYGHFFCHVFHHDYIVEKGHDIDSLERAMLEIIAARGAEYPAEHNVGHLYMAKPALKEFYQKLDPCNCFNPGVGQTAKGFRWSTPDCASFAAK